MLNVISDYYREKDETEKWADYTDLLALQFKYGLPNKESIYTYELGFNDRTVAMMINKALSITIADKDEVRKRIKANKKVVRVVIEEYPSYFEAVLNRL